MDKEQKQWLKKLHNAFAERYKQASEAYLNGYLTADDLQVYIENEQSVATRIGKLKDQLKDNELAKQYSAIASGELTVDDFITKSEGNLKIIELEYNKLLKTDTYTPEEAKQKLNKIKQLEKSMEMYNKLINDMKLSKSEYKPKKKPGRPKKYG